MENDINNIETAESERLLSGNVVKPHIYGAKEPVGLMRRNCIFRIIDWICLIFKQMYKKIPSKTCTRNVDKFCILIVFSSP